MNFTHHRVTTLALLSLLALLPSRAAAQAPDAGGVAFVAERLRGLDGIKRVLMIGAHPDDEDTSLLAALARGEGVDAAYLSLTRGEGGQNLIGPELFEGLGVVRTEELVAARRIDGARQFFTRAFDFGYSKNADEALALWPREELLRDVTWIVRAYRPQVIVSVFSGTPADGHGQHQAAGIMAREVFEAAADPARYPDQFARGVEPWQVTKLYQSAWRDPEAATTAVPAGRLDPVSGRSYHQIAMASRSQHRSQDMGAAQPLGPRASGLLLVESRGSGGADSGEIFAGVDTSFVSIAGENGEARRHAEAYRREIGRALGSLTALGAETALEALLTARSHLTATREALQTSQAELPIRESLLDETILSAAGFAVDARSSRDRLTPGETFRIDVEAWNGGSMAIDRVTPSIALPAGASARPVTPPPPPRRFGPPSNAPLEPLGDWEDDLVGDPRPMAAGAFERWSFEVRLPGDLRYSELYHQRIARDGAMYVWPEEDERWGLPRDPETFPVTMSANLAGTETRWEGAVNYRGVDPARGEFREPVLVLPAVSVELAPSTLVWPTGRRESRTVTVNLESHSAVAQEGTLRLEVPEGWSTEPREAPFSLPRSGARSGLAFELIPPSSLPAGEVTVRALALTNEGTFDRAVALVDYEHIRRTALFGPAQATIVATDVQVVDGLRIGYIMGTGDTGPAALREIGVEPVMVTTDDLASGDLDELDVLVLGVRAYESRADLVQYNETVLDFVRSGGVLISQYNQYGYNRPGIAPYPVEIRRPHDRVTDETASVTLLDRAHPILAGPNPIGPEDFEGWVQERGLYFLGEWDDAFQPLLEMADPGEEPKRGALLVAPLGEGTYVYTGLALFRQFPAGVAGAYRLLANLVSLGRRTAS